MSKCCVITTACNKKEVVDKIMKSLLRNEDILPGLRVNKMFANCVDKDVLIADELQNDLKHLQDC